MRRATTLAILFMLLCMPLMASTETTDTKADSLKRLLATQADDKKSETYQQLYRLYRDQGNASASLQLVDDWIAFEANAGHLQNEGTARWKKIVVLSNYDRSNEIIAEAPLQMEWFAQHEQWENFYNTWVCKAEAYYYDRKVQTALREAQLMSDDAKRRENDLGRAMAYQLMSTIYADMGQTNLTIEQLLKSIKLLKRQKDVIGMLSSSYDYLCQAYDNQKEYEAELSTSEEWLSYLNSQSRPQNEIRSLYISCHLTQANALVGLGRTEEAKTAIEKATSLMKLSHDPINQYRYYLAMANVNSSTGNYPVALAYTDSVEQLGLEFGGGEDIRAEYLLKMGKSREAAELYKKLFEERDTLFNTEIRLQLDELNTLFKVDELKMQSRLERTRLTVAIISIIALALIGIALFAIRSSRRMKQANQRLVAAHQELEQRNHDLALANKRAEESSKMKTEFIKNISHEIRTPLNILSGFTQIVTSDQPLTADQRRDVCDRITENTNRITGLVNKMLALAEASSQSAMERTDTLPALQIAAQAAAKSRIAESTAPGKADAPVSFAITAQQESGDTPIMTNSHYATQALVLLLDNARQFTTKGSISLLVGVDKRQGIASYTVEDTGCGVPADKAENIFEEFVQLNPFADGTGIGLTIARNIARQLGGDIVLDTTYTGGARFVMTLKI